MGDEATDDRTGTLLGNSTANEIKIFFYRMFATRDTVSALVSFLVWLVGLGPSKCCQEVMHGKCS